MKLYLEGADALRGVFIEPKVNSASSLKSEGWSRLSMPLDVALTWIRTVCCQTIRGTTTILTGAFTLRGKMVVDGLKDYLSMLIQAVALPFIGVVGTVHPKTGLSLLVRLCERHEEYKTAISSSRYDKVVESIFRGIGGIPTSVVTGLTEIPEYLFVGSMEKVKECIKDTCTLPFKSLAAVFVGGWHSALHIDAHNASGVAFR